MHNDPTPNAQANARALRRGMTDSERRLWSGLRREQLGVKFRRQHPIGNYIADFACLDPKLVIELDGAQHGEQAEYDARRDAFLREHGFKVLRFPTDAPLTNLEGVRVAILEQLTVLADGAPIPTFPRRGKESTSVPAFPRRGKESAPIPAFPRRGKESAPIPAFPRRGKE